MKIKYKTVKKPTQIELDCKDLFDILTDNESGPLVDISFQTDGTVEYTPEEGYVYGEAVFNKKTNTVTVKNED